MAKIRIGFSTHFEVENELVGIGTDNPTNTKQVLGNINASNIKAIGISTFTTYQGFLDKEARFGKSVININSQAGTLAGDVVIDGDVTVSSGSTLCSGVDELSLTDSFSVPTGNTDSRIHCKTAGSMRFNEDLGTLEFYTGDEWRTVNSYNRGDAAGRQVLMGGHDGSAKSKLIEYFSASTGGSTTEFGELFHTVWTAQGNSNHVRGIHAGGGDSPNFYNVISYITIASEGDAIDFGDLTQNSTGGITVTSSTRGVFGIGGVGGSYVNSIEYVEIMTLGNSLDFGDYHTARSGNGGGCSNGTRGLFMGGYGAPSLAETADISSISIASKGNAVNFGYLTQARAHIGGFSNSIRGIAVGGTDYDPNVPNSKVIDFVTIASEGNATDFGEISYARRFMGGSATQTRGFIMPGFASDATFNRIETITIASGGNSVDFGDSINKRYVRVASDSHGGLGGF